MGEGFTFSLIKAATFHRQRRSQRETPSRLLFALERVVGEQRRRAQISKNKIGSNAGGGGSRYYQSVADLSSSCSFSAPRAVLGVRSSCAQLLASKSSSLPPLSPPPRARSTPTDASDPAPLRGDDKGRRLRDKHTKRLPASASAPLLKADESSSRRSSVGGAASAGEVASGAAGASAAAGASVELERARLLHALGVHLC